MGNHVSVYINHLTEGDETTHTNTGATEKARVVSKGQVDYLFMWLYPSAVITSTDSFFFFSKRAFNYVSFCPVTPNWYPHVQNL